MKLRSRKHDRCQTGMYPYRSHYKQNMMGLGVQVTEKMTRMWNYVADFQSSVNHAIQVKDTWQVSDRHVPTKSSLYTKYNKSRSYSSWEKDLNVKLCRNVYVLIEPWKQGQGHLKYMLLERSSLDAPVDQRWCLYVLPFKSYQGFRKKFTPLSPPPDCNTYVSLSATFVAGETKM